MRKKGLQICEVPFECNHVLHFIFLYTQVIILDEAVVWLYIIYKFGN